VFRGSVFSKIASGAGFIVIRNEVSQTKFDGLVKSPKTVMRDLIPAKVGIFDRHPKLIEITGFRLSSE